jgi:putative ABC transport system permease protein
MFMNSIRMALKVLARRKFFTFISLFAISFTLLVLIVGAALLDHIFGAHEPHAPFDRLLAVQRVTLSSENLVEDGRAGYWLLDATLRDLPGAEQITIVRTLKPVISFYEGKVIRSQLKLADAGFWRIFDFRFIEGGPFSSDDEQSDRLVAVINEATRERFFGDAPAEGEMIDIEGQSYRVVGVVRNVPMIRFVPSADIWIPLSPATLTDRDRPTGDYVGLVVAESRAELPSLRREFASRVSRVELPATAVGYSTVETALETPFETLAREIFGDDASATRLRLLFAGAALLFMLLPAVNLVNLNVSRILERSSEIGVRRAFGASSRGLIVQFVTENLVVCLVGGAVGLAAAAGALALLNRLDLIAYSEFAVNARIAGYAIIFALVFGVLSGLIPAWRMAKLHPVEALRRRSA